MKTCKFCGCPNEDSETYCMMCGKRIDGIEETVKPVVKPDPVKKEEPENSNKSNQPTLKTSTTSNLAVKPKPQVKSNNSSTSKSSLLVGFAAMLILGTCITVVTSIVLFAIGHTTSGIICAIVSAIGISIITGIAKSGN